MTETNETVDLWGDIITEPIRTPFSILKEQGSFLERKTNGVLTVEIRRGESDSKIFLSFYIKAPSLNYSYLLFQVSHPITLFPAIFQEVTPVDRYMYSEGGKFEAAGEDEFIGILKDILQSPKTQKVISSLLSQSVAV